MRDAARGLAGLLNLPALLRLWAALALDRRTPLWLKLCAVAGFAYIFSPLDVFPDVLTGIGLLDDLIVSFMIIQAFVRHCPRGLVEEHCTRLNIDPRRIDTDIPDAVARAMNLTAIILERRRAAAQAARAAAANGHSESPAAEPGAEPRYSRYSAFNKDKE